MSESIPDRKGRHLDICLDISLPVETGSTHLNRIQFPHRSIPRSDASSISLKTDFLGYKLKMPVMISCMTGGTEEGRRLNRLLARVAGERGLAIGTGSIRVMLRHPEMADHFSLKKQAPEVPVIANIGAGQLKEYSPATLIEAVKIIEADGLYIHLNPAQELYQEGGDTDFSNWRDDIRRVIDNMNIPILIKETGAGIPPVEGLSLLADGAEYIDVAGAGGTDWVAVETLNAGAGAAGSTDPLLNWGYSTGQLLWAYRTIRDSGGEFGRLLNNRIIASGGLRSPRDFAISLASGAYIAAAALPFIRLAAESGTDGVHTYIDDLEKGLRSAVVLSGSSTLESFRKLSLITDSELEKQSMHLVDEVMGNNRSDRLMVRHQTG